MYGWQGTILRIDLTREEVTKEPLSMDLAARYLGGGGLNARLLYDEVGPDTDPMGPDNALIFGVGPMVGSLAPSSGRITVTSKSPLSGIFGDTNAGGQFGAELKYAGYDHIIIKGKAKEPVYLWIDSDEVEIRKAGHLWGKTAWETDDVLKEELGDERIKTAVIGPASEAGIKFGAIILCRFRAGGRGGGMGTVMGSKNLKGIAVRGAKTVKMAEPQEVMRLAEEARASWEAYPAAQWFQEHGTLGLVPVYVGFGGMPIRAGQTALMSPEKVEALSTTVLHKKYETGKRGCFGCFVACTPFHDIREGPYAGSKGEKPELPAVICFSAFLDMDSIDFGIYMSDQCNIYGIDIVETGAVLGMAFYWYQKGLIDRKDTDGLDLVWGNQEAAVALFHKMIRREGLGATLALGVKGAVDKMGPEYEPPAGSIKGIGNIVPDPRVTKSYALGAAVSPRGADHLKHLTTLERQPPELGKMLVGSEEAVNPMTEEDKHLTTVWCQDLATVLDSVGICKFPVMATFLAISPEMVARLFSAVTGIQMTYDQLRECGERNWNVMRCFNARQGLDRKHDTLPAGMSTTPKPDGPGAGMTVDLDRMLDDYYELRGWDENGIPTRQKLEALELGDMAKDLGLDSKDSDS